MFYSAVDRGRCLSLVPNTANLNMDSECASAKVDGGVLLNGVVRDAYLLSRTSKVCTEVLQEHGRWDDMQFHTYSNIVTSYECVTEKETPWLRASQLDQQQWIWDNETGAIVNPRSGSCLQIGGAMDQQCSTLASTNKVYLTPSPYPAYLYPCDRGCDPESMQRWILEPDGINDSSDSSDRRGSKSDRTGAGATTLTYRIRLKSDRRLCLRSGIDEERTSRWTERSEPWIAGVINVSVLLATFAYEFMCSRWNSGGRRMTELAWKRSHVFLPGAWWWCTRLVLSLPSCFGAAFFTVATQLPPNHGGRGFYPRQILVFGNLLYISMLFVHMVLIARDAPYDGKQNDEVDVVVESVTAGYYRDNTTTERSLSASSQESTGSEIKSDMEHSLAPTREMERRRQQRLKRKELLRDVRACPTSTLRNCCKRTYWFGIVERPSILVHGITLFWWRTYASVAGTDKSSSPIGGGGTFVLWTCVGCVVVSIFWTISQMIAKVRARGASDDEGGHDYQSLFLRRWLALLLFQWCNLIGSFFSPGGPPTWFPLASTNVCILGVLAESMLGSIPQRNFAIWASKYHVVAAALFSVPLILVST